VAPGTIEDLGYLLWSSQTNELIVPRSLLTAHHGELLAIHATSGAIRTLDSTGSIPLSLAPDGSAVYYAAISSDFATYFARRVALAAGSSPRTLRSCAAFCLHFIEPAPDGDRVAIGTTDDSLLIYQLSNGLSAPITEGFPRAFSPDGSRLLVSDFFAPLSDSRIVTLANGASQPAGLGLPDTVAGYKVRWSDTGLEILYISSDRRHLYRRDATAGTTTLIWTSADTLFGAPFAWSSSGARAALWSSRLLDPTHRRWELHGIDLATGADHFLAYGVEDRSFQQYPARSPRFAPTADIFPPSPPGGLAFAPDENGVAYSWFGGRLYRVAWGSAVTLIESSPTVHPDPRPPLAAFLRLASRAAPFAPCLGPRPGIPPRFPRS
jgi:hypothetical protein